VNLWQYIRVRFEEVGTRHQVPLCDLYVVVGRDELDDRLRRRKADDPRPVALLTWNGDPRPHRKTVKKR
jgi:hypothetical protein